MSEELCPECGKVHAQIEHLGIKLSKEDADKLRMIVAKAQSARSAMHPNAIGDGVSPEKMKTYLIVLNSILADCVEEETQWWKTAIETYNLPKDKNVSLNNNFEEFVVIKQ